MAETGANKRMLEAEVWELGWCRSGESEAIGVFGKYHPLSGGWEG